MLRDDLASSTIPKAFELDGSNGPVANLKTQEQYVEDVKVYLGAARAALQSMTGITLEAMCSDPNIDPAYVGCARELLQRGRTGDSNEKKDAGYLDGSECSVRSDEADDEVDESIPRWKVFDLPPILPSAGEGPLPSRLPVPSRPRYAFTIHFLPQGEPDEANLNLPPVFSALSAIVPYPGGIRYALGGQRKLLFKGGCWTSRGDLVVLTSEDFHLPDDILEIVDFPLWLKDFLHLPSTPTICYRRQGTIRYFLRIHDIVDHAAKMNDWTLIRTSLQNDAEGFPNADYRLPPDFYIGGESVRVGDGKWDAYVDLSGLGDEDVQRLRAACQKGIRFALMVGKKGAGPTGHLQSMSFVELKDEASSE